MNAALWMKCWRESRTLLLGTTLVMYLFCWLRVWIVSLLPMDRFKTVVEQFREFENFIPVPLEQLFTYAGRIALTYDELIVIVCICVWSISRGSDVVSGEIGRGTMEMLLSQPVTRLQILSTHLTLTILGVAILSAASWAGVATGVATVSVEEPLVEENPLQGVLPLLGIGGSGLTNALDEEVPTRSVPLSEKVDSIVFLPAAVNLFALGCFLVGLSALISSWDRYRWRSIGLVTTVLVVSVIMKIAGLADPRLEWLLNLTFLTAYEPEKFVSVAVNSPEATWTVFRVQAGEWTLGPVGYDLLLAVLAIGCMVAAAVVFHRRDVPAPD